MKELPNDSMMSFRNASLPERVAQSMADAIDRGLWHSVLPGVRSLAEEFEVSVPTIREALTILEHAGRVTPAVKGKPRKLIDAPARKLAPGGLDGKTVGFLVPLAPCDLGRTDRAVFDHMVRSIERHGGRTLVAAQTSRRDVSRAAERALAEPAELWVGLSLSRSLAQAMIRRKARCVFVNGDAQALDQPYAGPSFTAGIQLAIERLAALGHKRIVTLMHPTWLDEGAASRWSATRAALERVGIAPSSFHTQALAQATPEAVVEALGRVFSLTPPTAIIAPSGVVAIGCLTALSGRGILTPDEVSLISLADDSALQWTTPPLARVVVDPRKTAKAAVRFLEKAVDGKLQGQSEFVAPSELLLTESVSAIRRNANG